MRYQQKSFTLPVSDSVTQDEWDRIFKYTDFVPGLQVVNIQSPKRDWYAENDDGA